MGCLVRIFLSPLVYERIHHKNFDSMRSGSNRAAIALAMLAHYQVSSLSPTQSTLPLRPSISCFHNEHNPSTRSLFRTKRKRHCSHIAMTATSANPSWSDQFGTSALKQVTNLAVVVTRANDDAQTEEEEEEEIVSKKRSTGDTGSVFSDLGDRNGIRGRNSIVVSSALESLERDSKLAMFSDEWGDPERSNCFLFFHILIVMDTTFSSNNSAISG